MRKSIAAALIAASAATSACGQQRHEDAGPTVSRNYQVGAFQQIEVAGPYAVQVHTGANPGVSAQGPQKLLERTVVEVKGDKLVIHPQRHNGWFSFDFSSDRGAKFDVTVPQLSGATIAGSGDIEVDNVRGDRFDGDVAGSGGLKLDNVAVKALDLSISGSGDLEARAGSAQSANYQIAGSGGLDAGHVAAQQLKVSIMGSGDVRAHATGTADVSIMGSGDVDVTGGAKCTVHRTGSGDVNCS
jgi:hypothetical protein